MSIHIIIRVVVRRRDVTCACALVLHEHERVFVRSKSKRNKNKMSKDISKGIEGREEHAFESYFRIRLPKSERVDDEVVAVIDVTIERLDEGSKGLGATREAGRH